MFQSLSEIFHHEVSYFVFVDRQTSTVLKIVICEGVYPFIWWIKLEGIYLFNALIQFLDQICQIPGRLCET